MAGRKIKRDQPMPAELAKLFIRQNSQVVKYMTKLDKTLEAINDNNVLHANQFTKVMSDNTLQLNTALLNNTHAISNMATASLATGKIFRNVLYLLVLALIVLAGVEKLPAINGLFN